MENITSRFCDYRKDQQRLMDFWLDYRAGSDVRSYPTIWRIRLLLTSRVGEQKKDTQIWENESGQIIAFAMLWRRQPTAPYIVLDTYILPEFASNDLLRDVLQWGDQRASALAKEQKVQLTIYATGFSKYDFSSKLMKNRDYTLLLPNPDEHNTYFAKSLQNESLLPILSSGYKIYKLQESDDLESYQALYGFSEVDPLHQKELIESDEYFHLVVNNPDGEFVAYCEGSVCFAEWERTNQRIGWIDYVETKSDQQRKGLGKAILTAGLLQLQELGAETAMLITVSTNISAIILYKKTGFREVKIKEFSSYQKKIAFPTESSLME